MNERPRFRIWDNEQQKYFEPLFEAYKGKLLDFSIGLSGQLKRRTHEIPAEHESRFEGRYVVEQFTHRTDKDDNEIWQGDVLGLDDPGDKSKCVVIFHEGAFKRSYVPFLTKKLKKGRDYFEHEYIHNFDLIDKKLWKVIGTIHDKEFIKYG